MCPFCRSYTESIAHLINVCQEFQNFYNTRHNRIADKSADEIKLHLPRYRVYSNKLADSLFPELQDSLFVLLHGKPDIVVMDRVSKICFIVEIKVCFDLYFEYAYLEKIERYSPLLNILNENRWNVKLFALSFGSIACVEDDVWKCLRKLNFDKNDSKELMNWCSIPNLIMANFMWRHRVWKLFSLGG